MANKIRLTRPKVMDASPGLPKLVPVECMPVTMIFCDSIYTQGIKQMPISANTAMMPIDCEYFILFFLPPHWRGSLVYRAQIYIGLGNGGSLIS